MRISYISNGNCVRNKRRDSSKYVFKAFLLCFFFFLMWIYFYFCFCFIRWRCVRASLWMCVLEKKKIAWRIYLFTSTLDWMRMNERASGVNRRSEWVSYYVWVCVSGAQLCFTWIRSYILKRIEMLFWFVCWRRHWYRPRGSVSPIQFVNRELC